MRNVYLSPNKTVASRDTGTRNALRLRADYPLYISECQRRRTWCLREGLLSHTQKKRLRFWISKAEILAKAHPRVCYGSRNESASLTETLLRNGSSAVPEIPPKFHGTLRFIIIFSTSLSSLYLLQSCTRPIQSTPSLTNSFRSILILYVKWAEFSSRMRPKLNTTLCQVRARRTQNTCTCAQSSPIDRISVNPADHDD